MLEEKERKEREPCPRGYYRCSSSKGCVARKQVERSRSDHNTFILTYTGEHNHAAPTHRNSLAGTTRHKFPSSSAAAAAASTTPLRTPSMEEEEEELLVEDMEMAGEDELVFLNADRDDAVPLEPMSSLFDIIDEPLLGFPWVSGSASTTADEPATGAAGARS